MDAPWRSFIDSTTIPRDRGAKNKSIRPPGNPSPVIINTINRSFGWHNQAFTSKAELPLGPSCHN